MANAYVTRIDLAVDRPRNPLRPGYRATHLEPQVRFRRLTEADIIEPASGSNFYTLKSG